jgi:hypothetical protein
LTLKKRRISLSKHSKAIAAVAAALMSLAFVGSASAASIGSTPVSLNFDTYEASNDGFVGPDTTTQTMGNGTYYVVTATGTWSNWGATLWDYGKVCGTPTASPLTASPFQVNYKAGIDPEFIYAFARGKRYDCTKLTTPKANDKLTLSVNGSTGTYRHYPAAGGPTAPSANHSYTYLVQGASSTRGMSFRFQDPHSSDNYGEIAFTVRTAKDSDCANWSSFRDSDGTSSFSNSSNCQAHLPSN